MEALPRHQCLIYEGSPATHLRSLSQMIKERLGSDRRCFFLNSPPMVAGLRSYLAASGIDVGREVQKGSLVLSSDESHLLEGRFDPERMIEMLAEMVAQSLADGYKGLFATGDMTWEFGAEKNFERLRDYERALEQLFQRMPALSGVCQYHRDTLPAQAPREALLTHRTVFINETLSRMNPWYSAAGDGICANVSDIVLAEMLDVLRRLPEA